MITDMFARLMAAKGQERIWPATTSSFFHHMKNQKQEDLLKQLEAEEKGKKKFFGLF